MTSMLEAHMERERCVRDEEAFDGRYKEIYAATNGLKQRSFADLLSPDISQIGATSAPEISLKNEVCKTPLLSAIRIASPGAPLKLRDQNKVLTGRIKPVKFKKPLVAQQVEIQEPLTSLVPSSQRMTPLRGCLKESVPKGLWEPSEKTVNFAQQEDDQVRLIDNLRIRQPDYYVRHGVDSFCSCKICRDSSDRPPLMEHECVQLETLSMRIRAGFSAREGLARLDHALLCAAFNKHRMTAEALYTPNHRAFLTDLCVSEKNKRRVDRAYEMVRHTESALELMRYKRRKGTYFKIGDPDWEFLDLDELAPEVRSHQPHDELNLHWETVEDSQMKGYALDGLSNMIRTLRERRALGDAEVSEQKESSDTWQSKYPWITPAREEALPAADIWDEFLVVDEHLPLSGCRPTVNRLWV